MYLSYIQHVGCPTRLLTLIPVGPNLNCPDCNAAYTEEPTWTNNPVPCPFIEQVNARCALVIKPTHGFFQSYKIGDDLHIGISDSRSVIHSYWTNGIVAQDTSWDKSILVYDFLPFFQNNAEWFDSTLTNFIQQTADKFKIEMADCLEDLESVDTDRIVDQCSFQSSQFEVFTHDYRENGETACKDSDEGDHTNCKHADEEIKKSKKEMVNLTRKLQRALNYLEMSPDNSPIKDLLQALRDVNRKLRDAILRENAEFSSTTVDLPEYDSVDMKAFLGTDEVPEQKSMLENVKEQRRKSREELEHIMGEAEILLQEYDHIRRGLSNK
ncbi:unnamed protein product [Caenorhabditis bovis]|uniref:MKRN2 opposite strand protein-like C-terminal domain-containing protein n=1 Tax=Caenorhabditis bovis TaxID=2654633 RepID=A0A8S1FDN6_9PELO|nr:unnamed protein product [Caenorhabditis bovis]